MRIRTPAQWGSEYAFTKEDVIRTLGLVARYRRPDRWTENHSKSGW